MRKSAGEHFSLSTALVRSAYLVNAVYADSARAYGLTQQQGQMLCVLMAQPYGMGELGAILGLAKSSLTGLVDRLAQRGMVRRDPDPEDARAVRVVLTEKGVGVAEEFYAETVRRVEALGEGLDDAERDALVKALAHVVQNNEVPKVFLDRDEAAARCPKLSL